MWVTINEEPCPKCGRRGDHGQRENDLCWRCNLPEHLDPEEHKKLISTLRWERENLLETKRDAHTLSVHRLRELYGTDGTTLLAQVLPMLDRNDRDLQALQGGDA